MTVTRTLARRGAQVLLTLVGAFVLQGVATSAASSSPVAAPASAAAGFQDPTKNIRCAVKGAAVTCIILRQNKAKCARLYTAGGSLKKTGPSVMNFGCFSTRPFASKRFTTLKFGKRTTIKGVTCVATKASGMKCTNRSRHGFSLSRKGSTSF